MIPAQPGQLVAALGKFSDIGVLRNRRLADESQRAASDQHRDLR
jgi:hypothetical protein